MDCTSLSVADYDPRLPGWRLLSQGAEARVFAIELFGMPAVAKHRFPKRYRVPELDARLRKERTVQEVRFEFLHEQVDTARHLIVSERIPGLTAKAFIDQYRSSPAILALMSKMGGMIAALHDAGITHGDLTTSNFICRMAANDHPNDVDQLVIIDFGLGGLRSNAEDKAVDLYVLERALISTHLNSQDLLDAVLAKYSRSSVSASATLQRLELVRARGRKRECFG